MKEKQILQEMVHFPFLFQLLATSPNKMLSFYVLSRFRKRGHFKQMNKPENSICIENLFQLRIKPR